MYFTCGIIRGEEKDNDATLYLEDSRLNWRSNEIHLQIGNFLNDNGIHAVHVFQDGNHLSLVLDGFVTSAMTKTKNDIR